ncbi:MAG: class I SAM-dependent methyltransferase [Bdellovibrionales bacterium]
MSARAEELADRLGLSISHHTDKIQAPLGEDSLKLVLDENGLALGFVNEKRGKPMRAEFEYPGRALGKSQIFRRAIGNLAADTWVCDATVGWGGDFARLLSCGWRVLGFERSPIMVELIQDGLERARVPKDRYQLVPASVSDWSGEIPSVIYLDPMFDKPKKSSKSPKGMQLLQALVGDGEVDNTLLDTSLKIARDRVVIKRPLKAKTGEPAPSFTLPGQSVRYDVWVKS